MEERGDDMVSCYQRVAVLVDVQNMFYSAKHQYRAKLNFAKLLDGAVQGRQLIRAIAYIVQTPDIDQTNFINMLQQTGYEVKSKRLRLRPDGTAKGDWDMGMAIDAISLADRLDSLVLVSGDGDFVDLVNMLKGRGVLLPLQHGRGAASGRDGLHADRARHAAGREPLQRRRPHRRERARRPRLQRSGGTWPRLPFGVHGSRRRERAPGRRRPRRITARRRIVNLRSHDRIVTLSICLSALLGSPRPGLAAVPAIATYACPMASKWLAGAEAAHLPVAAGDLRPDALLGVSVLIVPLERVRTEAEARWIADFAARGGKLLAVYWGSLVREEAQSRYPVYSLAPLLGIKPTGWRGADAVLVQPEAGIAGAEGFPAVRLARGLLVRVEPLMGTTVVARWSPPGVSTGTTGPLALRFGNHLYLALDLFAPQNDTPEARQLFFWAVDQLAPGLVFRQARERAGTAMAAVIRAQNALTEAEKARPDADFKSARDRLGEARDCAERARQAAITGQYREAAALSTRSLAIADEVSRLAKPPAD
jgi:hypothetical protein